MSYRDENEALRAALAAKDDEIARLRREREAPEFVPYVPNAPGSPTPLVPTSPSRRELELEAERELIRLQSSVYTGQATRRAAGPRYTLIAVTCGIAGIWSFWRAFSKAEPIMILISLVLLVVGLAFARRGTDAGYGR